MNSIVKLLLAFFILFLSNQVQSQETIIHYLSGTGEDNTVDWDFYCTEGK